MESHDVGDVHLEGTAEHCCEVPSTDYFNILPGYNKEFLPDDHYEKLPDDHYEVLPDNHYEVLSDYNELPDNHNTESPEDNYEELPNADSHSSIPAQIKSYAIMNGHLKFKYTKLKLYVDWCLGVHVVKFIFVLVYNLQKFYIFAMHVTEVDKKFLNIRFSSTILQFSFHN